MLRLLPDRRREFFRLGNANPKRGVLSEADDLRDLVRERDTQPLTMVRAESKPIVGQPEPQSNGGIPVVRATDTRVVDIVECGFHLESPKGCDEFTLAGDAHAIFIVHAEHEEQRIPSLVEPVWEVLCVHKSGSAFINGLRIIA